MASIQLLDQNTINKIAAGEVVERPVSVIKELVENAIDAKANQVTVEVKEGGLKLIRVTDNGSGIAKEEIKTAFLRHSTSKIKKASDLFEIHSLGFRGEALASISAVSMVELITKREAELTGVRYVIEGGQEKSYEEIGCPSGTSFIIKDLFYNTPARLKFMKTASGELGYISDLMNKLAMAHPEIGFKLISNGKMKLQTSGNNKMLDSIYGVYGKEIAKNLIEISHENDTMKIKGFIGRPHISRGNRSYENYYVNGRYVKSKVIEKAIEDAYKSRMMLHRYPFVVFAIDVLSKDVDVNVHPTKMEVRFMNEEEVYRLVYAGISVNLSKSELIPQVKLDETKEDKSGTKQIEKERFEPFETKKALGYGATLNQKTSVKEDTPPFNAAEIQFSKKTQPEEEITKAAEPIDNDFSTKKKATMTSRIDLASMDAKAYESITGKDNSIKNERVSVPTSNVEKVKETSYKGNQLEMSPTAFIDSTAVKSHKIVGQLFDTYWVVELEDKYYVIDQHAAHEKVLYEQIVKKLATRQIDGQRLLSPVVVNLSIQEMARYEDHKQLFSDLGFEVERFGENALMIRSVPFIFDKILDEGQFIQILDGLMDSYSEAKYDILLDDIATMACKAAVKGNDRLSKLEYMRLIDDLLKLEDPFHCPHGRPTIISMTKYELEKKFKRIQ